MGFFRLGRTEMKTLDFLEMVRGMIGAENFNRLVDTIREGNNRPGWAAGVWCAETQTVVECITSGADVVGYSVTSPIDREQAKAYFATNGAPIEHTRTVN